MAEAALIELTHISKIYHKGETREVRALDDVSLQVNSGEFVAVVGQSGSGKSTLMNILGCLDTPTKGTYKLNGMDVSHMESDSLAEIRNEMIGFVFQSFYLISGMNALANVELPLVYRGLPKKERRKIAKEALCRVGLEERMNHLPSEMSGGQQQRVAVARAIAAKPSLILADEPTGNLDSHSGEIVMKILAELNSEGRTVILITHDAKIAAKAGRQICIKDGILH